MLANYYTGFCCHFLPYFIMQKQGILHHKALFNFATKTNGQIDFEHTMGFGNLFLDTSITKSCQLKATIQCRIGSAVPMMKGTSVLKLSKIKSTLDENVEELSDDDDELCPVDCVLDEYDEQSETVPLFHFYKNGVLLEAFPTRDKERVLEAILKYTASAPQEVESTS
ncbi:Thioredoxin-like 4, chloroplastic [Sesamum angolense]|uniref:Thioredoxin-like 4, chloroplastic n=1 Tax=Sesamum angolense TaxID=2727404 RepID=A0AAE2BM91_9LAMI|nr:Thioredoxin-like 4, chloroplastic [Sesamum angolense]